MIKRSIILAKKKTNLTFYTKNKFAFSSDESKRTENTIDQKTDLSTFLNKILEKKKNEKDNELTDNQPQAKWMRFFIPGPPIKFDLERSMKNEATELIINYVRHNYISFEFPELMLALERKLPNTVGSRLFNEIKFRISSKNYNTTPSLLLSFLNFSPMICKNDAFISKFLCVEFMKVFSMYNFKEKIHVLSFVLSVNYMPENMIREFLLSFVEWKESKMRLDDFEMSLINKFLFVLNNLYYIMEPEKFKMCFSEEFLAYLFKTVCFK